MTYDRKPYTQRTPDEILHDWRTRPVARSASDLEMPGERIAKLVVDFSDPIALSARLEAAR